MACSGTRMQIVQSQSGLLFLRFALHDCCPPSAGAFARGRIPRTFRISSRRRKFRSASMVALTTLAWLLEPSDLARTSRIPAASTTARTPPPAMTPVPGEAGRNKTRPPPNSPIVSCGMVFSCSETFSIDLRAASDALRIASATSFALPKPTPTFPSWSPATINALKLKRRPPFTTLAQRLMKTTFSVVSPFAAGVLSVLRSNRLPGFGEAILKLQSAFARRICEGFHLAVEYVTTAIKDHVLHFLCQQLLRNCLANTFCRFPVRGRFFASQVFLQRRNRHHGFTGVVIDHLRVNMAPRKMDGETRSFCGSAHFLPNTGMNALPRRFPIRRHLTAPSCLPCGESARPRIARLCPCTAPADNICEYRPRPDRPVSCRPH